MDPSKRKTRSLKRRLMITMLFAALIPILLIDLIMYNRYLSIIEKNNQEMTQANLAQTKTALDTWIDSYGDILYQVCSDENISKNLTSYYENNNDELSKNYLNIQLRSLLYTKDYIMAITIVTSEGDSFFYDRITPFSSHTFWLNHYSMTLPEIYDATMDQIDTMYFSTEYAKTIPLKNYYLFHMAHRTTYTVGSGHETAVVIVSIDEQLLENICNSIDGNERDSTTFIVDRNGYIVSYTDSAYLSQQLEVEGLGTDEKKMKYLEFVNESGLVHGDDVALEVLYNEKLGWDLVNVSSKTHYQEEIQHIQQLVVALALGSGILVVFIILLSIRYLLRSINVIVDSMHLVEQGHINVRIRTTHKMPTEVVTIAEHLNKMLDQLAYSMEKEKLLAERERVAEISALEARINPHFLYNTLDTINWMAIDNDEVEISNAISALGKILRYGINESNAVVTISTEMDWLQQYVFLQQTRLKDTFKFNLEVQPAALQMKIHKLLLQPFVENSIIHGFAGKSGVHMLTISIWVKQMLYIQIQDNGVGMSEKQVKRINSGEFQHYDDKYHVGMENAFQRIAMYYGDNSNVWIESKKGEGTSVHIIIPKDGERS